MAKKFVKVSLSFHAAASSEAQNRIPLASGEIATGKVPVKLQLSLDCSRKELIVTAGSTDYVLSLDAVIPEVLTAAAASGDFPQLASLSLGDLKIEEAGDV
jgi:hypothetical protein